MLYNTLRGLMDEIKEEFRRLSREFKGITPEKQSRWLRFWHPAQALHERNVYRLKKLQRRYRNKRYQVLHREDIQAKRKERYELTGQ